jgi:hypothetical protein
VALITYADFLQRVRRYRPSELLPALAATAVQFFERDTWAADRVRLPWAIAAAAKASIISGNEYRSLGVSDEDVYEICTAYNALDNPLTNNAGDVSGSSRINSPILRRSVGSERCSMGSMPWGRRF